VINAVFAMWSSDNAKFGLSDPHKLLLSTFFIGHLVRGEPEAIVDKKALRYLLNVKKWLCLADKPTEIRQFVIPTCINGNHWILLAIDVRTQTLQVYDSLPPDDRFAGTAHRVAVRLQGLWDRVLAPKLASAAAA
jgi:Ulp1 family protease